ncbi:hypothetical protein [Alicyclobacillus ferrooxydans]|uniref:Uncharacterized protein n=1 Tax=Alicyclobacillus ferrooxydans TaxID=471514 RepID=A0A0P9CCI9_9BACL|nr:hypothetical protein [Alicyclobacillus ferrooxydans]KPV43243.1 hypothetical protein AN477_13405 [Alicyclobacillus ferrooxydans]
MVEAMFNLTIGALLVALVCEVVVALVAGQREIYQRLDTNAMWNSAARVVREDVHSAKTVQSVPGGMDVSEADGRVYRYQVNTSAELVRTQVGGGTSVLAVGVQAMAASVDVYGVKVTLQFADRSSEQLYTTFLPASYGLQ